MRRALVAVVVLIATALLVPSHESSPMLDEASLRRSLPVVAAPPRSIDELRARVAEVLAREGVPGAGIALVGRDGPIWIGGVGVADTTTRVPVDADTVFRVASITKNIIALGVMRLVEQGRLDLDRPLREIVPDAGIDNAWEAVAPVTLAQCLEHTAGLDDMRPNELFTDDDGLPARDALAINPRSRIIRWRPGSRMAYSNVGYTLAARAIEVATGEPFDAWLTREIVRPLGMPDADFRRTDVLASRLATGYRDRDHAARYRTFSHRPAGALLASPTDLAKLVQFWLRRGEGASLVSPAGLERIERTGTLPYPATDANYGLGNGGDVSHAARGRGHDGGLPGFISSLRYFPALGLGYVVLLDSTHSFAALLEIRALVFAALVRGKPLPPPPPAIVSGGPQAEFFAFASPRHALFGFLERALLGWGARATPDGVQLDPLLGPPIDLLPTPDGAYRAGAESGSSVRFARSPDGTPIMITPFAYAEAASGSIARAQLTALRIAMGLLELAPLWLLAVLVLGVVRRRRVVAFDLALWPAIAGLCAIALPRLVIEADNLEVIGERHPLTIAIYVTTLVFAFAACASVVAAVRWSLRTDRPPWWSRLVPSLCAVAALGLAIWLDANHVIGLRLSAW